VLRPYKEGLINALDRVQKKAAKFANRTKIQYGKPWRSVGRKLQLHHVQSIRRRTGVESYRGQVTRTM
jgi:hypothetical protein